MSRILLLALLAPTALAGSKVVRTPAYKKIEGLPSDLGIVLVGDATYEVKARGERDAVGPALCKQLVRYFKSTDTFSLVRCVVVPGGNVGTDRSLELGKETLELELPADGSSHTIDRREPAVILFIEDLMVLNTLDRETLEGMEGNAGSAFKKPVTLFGRFGWWDNSNGALIGYQGLDASTAKVLFDGADPSWDDLSWSLVRTFGAGMPFEFTW
jgi:hypothetical protein